MHARSEPDHVLKRSLLCRERSRPGTQATVRCVPSRSLTARCSGESRAIGLTHRVLSPSTRPQTHRPKRRGWLLPGCTQLGRQASPKALPPIICRERPSGHRATHYVVVTSERLAVGAWLAFHPPEPWLTGSAQNRGQAFFERNERSLVVLVEGGARKEAIKERSERRKTHVVFGLVNADAHKP